MSGITFTWPDFPVTKSDEFEGDTRTAMELWRSNMSLIDFEITEARSTYENLKARIEDLGLWNYLKANHTVTKNEYLIIDAGRTITLNSVPSVGSFLWVARAGDWEASALTLNPNGLKINGSASNYSYNKNAGFVLIYTGTDWGWGFLWD